MFQSYVKQAAAVPNAVPNPSTVNSELVVDLAKTSETLDASLASRAKARVVPAVNSAALPISRAPTVDSARTTWGCC